MILLKSLSPGSVLCTAALYCFFGGCLGPQTPSGASIVIQGPANDTVQWSATQVPNPQACSCTAGNFTGACIDGGIQPLGSGPLQSDGLVNGPEINKVVDDSVIQTFSNAGPTPCMSGPQSIPACPPNPGGQPIIVSCTPTNTAAAQGRATITGAEDSTSYQKCTRWLAGGDCANWETIDVDNSGVVSLTLNGQTVSVTYGSGSTPFSLGVALAIAMNQNSTLASQLMSAPNGPVVYVNAINTGTQYDYPWTTSCTYNSKYFSDCSFSIVLSPSASLASPSGPQ